MLPLLLSSEQLHEQLLHLYSDASIDKPSADISL